MHKIIFMVLVMCVLDVAGQLTLKSGVNDIGRVSLNSAQKILAFLKKAILCYKVWLSGIFYIAGAVIWLIVLSRADLSLAYPLISINFVLVVLAAWLFLKESLTLKRVLGILIICLGIVVLT